jgi:hypothetical protein
MPLHARTGTISLSLGTQPANIGEKVNDDPRTSISHALKLRALRNGVGKEQKTTISSLAREKDK